MLENALKRLTGLDIYYNMKNYEDFQDKVDHLARFTIRHQKTYIVEAEGDVKLFSNQFYQKIQRIKPNLTVVAGPVLQVSSFTHRSVLVELSLQGLIWLYYSDFRQPVHYVLGKGVVDTLVIEELHLFATLSYERQTAEYSGRKKPALLEEMSAIDEKIRKNSVRVSGLADIDKFIFLEGEEIVALEKSLSKRYGTKAVQTGFNSEVYRSMLDEIGIKQFEYPTAY